MTPYNTIRNRIRYLKQVQSENYNVSNSGSSIDRYKLQLVGDPLLNLIRNTHVDSYFRFLQLYNHYILFTVQCTIFNDISEMLLQRQFQSKYPSDKDKREEASHLIPHPEMLISCNANPYSLKHPQTFSLIK